MRVSLVGWLPVDEWRLWAGWQPAGQRWLSCLAPKSTMQNMAARRRAAAAREGAHANDASTSNSESSGSFPRRGARSMALSPTIRRRAASAIRKALVDACIKCLLTLDLCLLYPIAEKVKLHGIGLAANARPNRIGVAANVGPRRIGLPANVGPNRIGKVWKVLDYLQKATYRINLCTNVD